MEIDADPGPDDIWHTFVGLWRRRWWIAGSIVLLVALSLAKSLRATELYASQTSVRQADPNSFVVFQTQSGAAPNPERQTATQIELARSDAVEKAVRATLGDRFAQIGEVRVAPMGDTDILRITVKSADPKVARSAADAFAASYLQVSQATQVAALEHQAEALSALNKQNQNRVVELGDEIAQIDADIAALGPSASTGSEETKTKYETLRSNRQLAETRRSSLVLSAESLEQRIVQFQVEANARRDVAGQVLRPADLPKSPVSPKPARDALLYAMVGGLLGLALASARDALGGKLRDMESLIHVAPHLPVLGMPLQLEVPRDAPASSVLITVGDVGNSSAQEAYRALRTAVQSATLGSTLLITSPAAREGKTTVAANLAGSLASAGSSVAVVCLDFHRPHVHDLFAQSNAVGLTSVLLGRNTLDEALITIEVGGGLLRLLASGPLPPNAAELLGSSAVGELLELLRKRFDYVLLDTPPVMSVTDPIVASRWANHVLLVARVGRTTTKGLHLALDRLDRAGVAPLGLVFNGATASISPAYYYAGYAEDAAEENVIPRDDWDRIVRNDGSAPGVGGAALSSATTTGAGEVPGRR